MALITTYQDLFPSSTIMRQWPGNGTITIPGNGDARLFAPNSVGCDFNYGANIGGAPILYERISTLRQSLTPSMPFYVEAKLNSITATTGSREVGLAFFTTPYVDPLVTNYIYRLCHYKNEGKIVAEYAYPTSETRLFTGGSVSDPSNNYIFRLYWNPYNRPIYIPETSTILQADYLAFVYSVDNGTNWTCLGTRARDFDLSNAYAGIFVRKWETSAVNCQADFAYFTAKEYNVVDQQLLPDAYGRNRDLVGLEDAGGPITQSGPASFDSPDGIREALSLREGPRAGFEDTGLLPSIAGRDARFDYPQVSEEYPLAKDRVSLEESTFVQLDNTDYIKAKYDADGREFLGNYGVRHVLYYDATLEPWHVHGAGFYGAGRDGVLYYNGEACTPGPFCTLAGGLIKKSWSSGEVNGYFLDAGQGSGTTLTVLADDKVRLAITGANGNRVQLASVMRWFLTGNFDISVSWENWTQSSGSDGGCTLIAAINPKLFAAVRRNVTGRIDSWLENPGVTDYQFVGTSTTSGKFRITRTGSSVSRYYWTGSAWAQLGSAQTLGSQPIIVRVLNEGTGGATTSVDVFGFTITSGTTTNLIGWAREAAGTYRGSQVEFPLHALIVSSGNSADIIDADTNKLWMSFRGGSNNEIGGDGNYCINQAVMKDGALLLSYRTLSTYGTADGAGLWIDFTLDFMRHHRGAGYNDAGMYYNVELTTGVWPRDSANGCIAFRNSGRGATASHFDNWQFQNNRANWMDLLHDAGFQYRLIANNGGVYLCKWQRWKFEGTGNAHLNIPDYAISTQVVATYWAVFRPVSKDVLSHNRINLWITHYATWSAVIGGGGGTWLENHQYALAGTIDLNANGALAQDSMTLDDAAGLLFYARNEGVYVMDLATGTSTLIYGKVGSGATHAVLPDYATISSVKLVTDGVAVLLLVGMARPDRIWAVARSTHTIYWKGFMDDAHQPLSMAVGA